MISIELLVYSDAKELDGVRIAHDGWTGEAVLYSHLHTDLVCLPKNASIPITLNAREYEVFTVVAIKEMSIGSRFAPIGLVNMFNSGGAIKELKYETEGKSGLISMKVRGCGTFGAYSSTKPKRIQVHNEEVQFHYDESSGLVTVSLKSSRQRLIPWGCKGNKDPEAHIFKVDDPEN
ncbi:hypothetical protein FXO38_03093 [Capsicum annuum]|nr:hypothetical protein FXO37_21084 [Capsicum annuum]KAF3678702.1 hypothetical protein FXO38_03093 [Capsicum annuum]